MDKRTVSHHLSSLILIVTFLLAGCGGGGQADNQASPSQNDPDLVSLSALDFNRAAKFTPDRMLATSTVQLQVGGVTVAGEHVDASHLVIWASSDESVVTVDEHGLVTAVAEGAATVSAKWDRGDVHLESSHAFQVRGANITISANRSPVFVGDQVNLSVSARWDDGPVLDIADGLTLQTDLPAIASFDIEADPFELTTHDVGTVTITARFMALSHSIELPVNPAFNLTAEPAGINQINLSWTPVENATSYTIEWWTTGYFGLPVAAEIPGITATSYVHQNLATYSKYSYRIRAHMGNTSITSPQVSITLPENNAANIHGALVGSGVAPAHGQAFRRTIDLVIDTLPDTLLPGKAYLLRDKVRSPYESGNIVIPLTNISDWQVYCSVSASGREVRDINGDVLSTTVVTGFIFYGSVRDWGGSTPYNERCIAPGKTGYLISGALFSSAADVAVSDFMDIASVHLSEISFWSYLNDPINDAVIPQSYQIIPASPAHSNPQLEVAVTNMGANTVVLYDPTVTPVSLYRHMFLLLDDEAEPLYVGQLTADPTWDGILAQGEQVKLLGEINFDASASSVYIWTRFSKQP